MSIPKITDTVDEALRRTANFTAAHEETLLEIKGQVRDIYEEQKKQSEILNGKDGGFGIYAKVNIMWRLHGWLILGIGVGIGALIEKLAGK